MSLADGSVFTVTVTAWPAAFDRGDYDGDGIPNNSDDCPVHVNPLQENADGDSFGDVCDPFPNTADNNPLAQCAFDLETSNAALSRSRVELAQTQSDVAACQARRAFADVDGDGEEDSADRCAGTPPGTQVDGGGCSLEQLCAAHASTCKSNDWMNDEPGVKKPRDCVCD